MSETRREAPGRTDFAPPDHEKVRRILRGVGPYSRHEQQD
jgi:hypothetical protein